MVQILQKDSGKHFDPLLVNVFVQHLAVFHDIFNTYEDESPEVTLIDGSKAA